MQARTTKLAIWAATVALVFGATACSSSDDSDDAAGGTTTAAAVTTAAPTTAAADAPITILLTNDDGIGGGGIDELAKQLGALPGVTIEIVAPAENQSGKGDSTTEGELVHKPGKTISGIEGTAVEGTPADSVKVALDELGLKPDLVASGINQGQNVGPLTNVSGTVGAALTAARRGVPAIAGSAGLKNPDYELGAKYIVEWVKANRDKIAKGDLSTDEVVNINVPECTAGTAHDIVDVPTAKDIPEGVMVFEADCAATPATFEPTDDVDALAHGFSARSLVPIG